MGILTNFKNILTRRKQLKLDRAREEKIANLRNIISAKISNILTKESDNKYYEISKILEKYIEEAFKIGMIKEKNIYELAEYFKEKDEIKEVIYLRKKYDKEKELCAKIGNAEYFNSKELKRMIDEHIEEYCLGTNKFKLYTEKQKYGIIRDIVERQSSLRLQGTTQRVIFKLDDIFRESFHSMLVQSTKPEECLRIYNQYVREFLHNNFEEEVSFREEFDDKDFLRKLDCLQQLGENVKFDSLDKVPLFYDTSKEEFDEQINEELNGELAASKKDNDITAKDLLFIRTTQVFPVDGVVEPIGEYSKVENIGNPFSIALKNIKPDITDEELNVLSPRFRWTSHWCINGIVGNHAWGDFSGRDFLIIEDANEHKNDENIVNLLVADVIHVGDMKLSKNARIMMSYEKYIELMEEPKMKKQLEKLNIILYKGEQSKALKKYMNEKGYVYGEMASSHYISSDNLDISEFLRKITVSEVEGYEHCASRLDENLMRKDLKSKAVEVFEATSEATRKKIGSNKDKEYYNERTTINEMSASIDNYLQEETFKKYIGYLSDKFPQMEKLKEAFIKAIKNRKEKENFDTLSEEVIKEVGIDNIIMATREFNEIIREEQKEARRKKDKELFDKGLITEEEYKARRDENNFRGEEEIIELNDGVNNI